MKSFAAFLFVTLLLATSGLALILFGCMWINKSFDEAWAELDRFVRAALD